jgi:hypothetical protein
VFVKQPVYRLMQMDMPSAHECKACATGQQHKTVGRNKTLIGNDQLLSIQGRYAQCYYKNTRPQDGILRFTRADKFCYKSADTKQTGHNGENKSKLFGFHLHDL